METLANFFDWINDLLGVSGAGELTSHPIFIGLCILILIYAWLTGQKYVALGIFGLIAGTLAYYYLYPKGTVQISDLLMFLAAMGVIALLIIYFGFIKE
ncbi:MAG: hypothetical protein ACLQPD_32995 [Desulfomonilaceae bacterium]